MPSSEDDSNAAAATIEHEMIEYLRLQPHERDNFSILLYNCESAALPTAVVKVINRINATREDDKITCEVLLMHRDEDHLRQNLSRSRRWRRGYRGGPNRSIRRFPRQSPSEHHGGKSAAARRAFSAGRYCILSRSNFR